MSPAPGTRPTVLLVPGAMTGAWIWEDNFASFFREADYPVHALSFRGHGSPFFQRLGMGFEDYVDDCVSAIKRCEELPLIIGHSLGGLVSLHAATRAPVAAMVLLSPAPVQGMLKSISSLARKSPISVAKFSAALVEARLTRFGAPPLGIYSDTCDSEQAGNITRQLKSESLPVMLRLLSPPRLPVSQLSTKRILFIGASGDEIIPPDDVARSAKLVDAEVHIYEGLCHTYQAERGWKNVAEDVLRFFKVTEPNAEAPEC